MKVVVVGATGTIGQAIVQDLSTRHDVIRVGHSSGDVRVDITDWSSIARLFATTGKVDAVVSAAGNMHVGPFATMTEEQMRFGPNHKLLGQISLARLALDALNDGGSITLSSGLASRAYRPGWSLLTAVNVALEGFVRSAATEVPRGLRINVVSPGAVMESLMKWNRDPAMLAIGTPAADVAKAYVRFVEGRENGQVADAGRI